MKNRNQINKRLITNKYLNQSIYIIYSNNELESINYLIDKYENILILGRNNSDIDKYSQLSVNKNIRFLTVHKSKGLEEENVAILNVVDDSLGFPNKIKENKILDYIRESDDLESERRISKEQGERFAKENNINIFVETSAKTGINAQKTFIDVADLLYKDYLKYKDDESQASQGSSRSTEFGRRIENKKKKKSCC